MPFRLPQARDFDKLRHLLRLIASGQSDRQQIGQAMGAGPGHAARGSLRRLETLTPELKRRPLTLEELVSIRDRVRLARPIAERLVAAIVGVPGEDG